MSFCTAAALASLTSCFIYCRLSLLEDLICLSSSLYWAAVVSFSLGDFVFRSLFFISFLSSLVFQIAILFWGLHCSWWFLLVLLLWLCERYQLLLLLYFEDAEVAFQCNVKGLFDCWVSELDIVQRLVSFLSSLCFSQLQFHLCS